MNSRDTLVTELNVLADFNPKVPANFKDCEYLMLGNLTPLIQIQTIEQLDHSLIFKENYFLLFFCF